MQTTTERSVTLLLGLALVALPATALAQARDRPAAKAPVDALRPAEARLEGPQPADSDGNHHRYEAGQGETLSFHPAPGGDESHEVWGQADISVRASDRVDVRRGPWRGGEWFTIVVTHADGSKDTFFVRDGFHVNLNAHPPNVTWFPAGPRQRARGVPSGWESFTLNGQGAPDPSLAAWYEEAHAYYQAVQSGSQPMPDPAAWSELLSQMEWAYEQIHGTDGPFDGAPPGAKVTPFGEPFPGEGRAVHRRPVVRLDHSASTGIAVHDIWSRDVTIDVAPTSARVTVEVTTDTRVEPPERVLKIVVTDPATGTTTTYVVHDDRDAEVRIRTPSGRNVRDASGRVRVEALRPRPRIRGPGPPPGPR